MTHDYKAALEAFKQQIKEFEQNLPSLTKQDGAFKHYEAAIYALKIADRLMQGPPRSTPERIWQVTRDHLLKEVEQKND